MIDEELVVDAQKESPEVTERVVFRIGDMLLAITVAHVREILDVTSYTAIPQAPSYVLGMIDVRSTFIAVLDFAQRLGYAPSEQHSGSRILVLDFGAQARAEGGDHDDEGATEATKLIGVLTDGVVTVAELEEGSAQDLPFIGEQWQQEVVTNVARLEGEAVVEIDLEQMLSDEPAMLYFESKPS